MITAVARMTPLRRRLNGLLALLFALSALSLPFSAHARAMERATLEHAATHAQADHDLTGDMHATNKQHCPDSRTDGANKAPMPDDRSACGSCLFCFVAAAEEIGLELAEPPAGRIVVARPDTPTAESVRPPLHPPRA